MSGDYDYCGCGRRKGVEYEVCRECAEVDREALSELQGIPYLDIIKETPKAWLVRFEEDMYEPVDEWLPKSQCSLDKRAKVAAIPAWLVEERGLDGYL